MDIENKWNDSIFPTTETTTMTTKKDGANDESAVLCQPKNYGNTGSRRPVKPIRDQNLSPSKSVPEVWKCKRLAEGFLEGITRIRHGSGEIWRREHKKIASCSVS